MTTSAAAAYAAAGRAQPNALQPVAVNNIRMSFGTASSGIVMSEAADNSVGASVSASEPGSSSSQYTTTALSRWSLLDHKLPAAGDIKSLHIYDFDNTLFKTPVPNQKLWNTPTIGYLSSQDVFVNGGWWHDARILGATGEGIAKEEPRAWEGWWNEQVVDLVRLTAKEDGALAVLLTGRSDTGFGDLIKRIVASKGLEFDMVVLKPAAGPNNEKFSSTMVFKQAFLETLMETYSTAEHIKIYEDRPRHVQGFREFLTKYNRQRQPALHAIAGEVIPVVDMAATLDPVIEAAEVQHMVNIHNAAGGGKKGRLVLNKTVFFTGYLLKEEDSQKLLSLVPAHAAKRDTRYHANSVLICPRPCPPHILNKVGGMGSKMTWEVVATGSLDNTVWAASVRPVPQTAKYHVEGPVPIVVLAVSRTGKPHDAGRIRKWHPVPSDKAFVFETTVGEKALLRVEFDRGARTDENEQYGGALSKRKHPGPHYAATGSDTQRSRQATNLSKGPIPTQPSAFMASSVIPRQPSGRSFGQQGRGFHAQAAGRGRGGGGSMSGNLRGQGFNGNRGGFRGGAAAMRGRGGGGNGGGNASGHGNGNVAMVPGLPPAPGAPGAPTGPSAGRAQQHRHHYQSLDDAGAAVGANQSMVYDDLS